jgi:hypothetical protein
MLALSSRPSQLGLRPGLVGGVFSRWPSSATAGSACTRPGIAAAFLGLATVTHDQVESYVHRENPARWIPEAAAGQGRCPFASRASPGLRPPLAMPAGVAFFHTHRRKENTHACKTIYEAASVKPGLQDMGGRCLPESVAIGSVDRPISAAPLVLVPAASHPCPEP